MLHYLYEHEGKAVTRVSLLEEVWGYSYMGGSNVVEAAIRALRKKLGACIFHRDGAGRGLPLSPILKSRQKTF